MTWMKAPLEKRLVSLVSVLVEKALERGQQPRYVVVLPVESQPCPNSKFEVVPRTARALANS
jgi:hypothetical protein